MHSGSGTLLRYAVVLASLLREPLHMTRIRAKRDKPGLRPQHLEAVKACASLCAGRLEGGDVGSQEIVYTPSARPKGGAHQWDIGTAGSTTMLAYSAISLALFATGPCRFTITGGLFQDFAPSAFHMQRVLLPTLSKMGASGALSILRPGYVPEGGGKIQVSIDPVAEPLKPVRMLDQGRVAEIHGISLASHLDAERVAERMAEESRERLADHGHNASLAIQHDSQAVQRGATLLLWAQTSTGCLIGADQAGKRGRRSESIARYCVRALLEDLASGATVDRHLADQLILFAALAQGRSEYLIPRMTDHVESNLWLVGTVLGAKTEFHGRQLSVEGIGFYPSRSA